MNAKEPEETRAVPEGEGPTTKRVIEKASPEHEASFRETWELLPEFQGDPYWEAAYEHAATHKLYGDEMNAIGGAIRRKAEQSTPQETVAPKGDEDGSVSILQQGDTTESGQAVQGDERGGDIPKPPAHLVQVPDLSGGGYEGVGKEQGASSYDGRSESVAPTEIERLRYDWHMKAVVEEGESR